VKKTHIPKQSDVKDLSPRGRTSPELRTHNKVVVGFFKEKSHLRKDRTDSFSLKLMSASGQIVCGTLYPHSQR
jgi:hypothetical protein